MENTDGQGAGEVLGNIPADVPGVVAARPLVIYHKGCFDGTASALVAYLVMGPGADYLAASYADPPVTPDLVKGRDVYLIDFSYKPDVMTELVKASKRLVYLDHHKSAKEGLGPFIASQYPNITYTPPEDVIDDRSNEAYKAGKFGANLVIGGALTNFGYFDCFQDALVRQAFSLEEATDKETADRLRDLHRAHKFQVAVDMERSGASIAWDYFFTSPKPDFIKLIEDRDLWRNSMEGVEEFHSFLFTIGFNDPKAWMEAFVTPVDVLIERGKVAKAAKEAACTIAMGYSGLIDFEGLRACALNFCLYQGDVGHLLVERSPDKFGVLYWWDQATKQWMVSMRSKGDLDVSRIAQKYGGGGHKAAAGFQCQELPWSAH